ncbi:MAG: hypothetical protein D6722_26755 [Bacteroidetes bacterium]|nr:MAG: hypothetical protein D6722_26755 [Bacteroidota bacterium]
MEPIFMIEMGLVALAVLGQLLVFFRNGQAIQQLSKLFPPPSHLRPETKTIEGSEVTRIAEQPTFGVTFREIVRTTNAYLERNRGAADFDILKEIADRKVMARERAIEANITLPLYIGLLCTFTGVIIGLVQIALNGVSDAAIQSFIGGVLIGMIGSASGLALTVRSNFAFKESKKTVDQEGYGYLTFLRTAILPALHRSPEAPLADLRDNLAAFNDGFVRYQSHVNDSLGESLRLFNELKAVFSQLRSLEQGLGGIQRVLHSNDGLIEKQTAYLESYAQRAEAFSRKLGTHLQTMDQQVDSLVSENIKALERSTQAAYVKMDQYLASLEGTDRKAAVSAIQQDLGQIRGDVKALQEKSLAINEQLLRHLSEDQASRKALTEEIRAMNARLEKVVAGRGDFVNSGAYRAFVYAGTAACVAALGGGIFWVVQTLVG